MFSLDVEQAYYELYMAPAAEPWLCFEHEGDILASSVLLFGAKPAGFWFTKTNRPGAAFFRVLLARALNYLDDWLFSAEPDRFTELRFFALAVFDRLGWSLNDKCVTTPCKSILCLGIVIDAELCKYKIPPQSGIASNR